MPEITHASVEIHDPVADVVEHSLTWSATLCAREGLHSIVRTKRVVLDANVISEVRDAAGTALRTFLGAEFSFEDADLPDYEDGETGATFGVRS